MTITLDTSYPFTTAGPNPVAGICPSVSNNALLVVITEVNSSTPTVSSVSDSNAIVPSFTPNGTYTDVTNGHEYEIWSGLATSSGVPSVSVTWVGAGGTSFAWVALSLVFSGTQHWRLVGSTVGITNASSTTMQFPTLNSDSSTDQCYVGFEFAQGAANNAPSSGFTCFLDPGNNPTLYNLSLSASTGYSPSTTSTAGYSSGIAAIFSADVAPSSFTPSRSKVVLNQAVNRAGSY